MGPKKQRTLMSFFSKKKDPSVATVAVANSEQSNAPSELPEIEKNMVSSTNTTVVSSEKEESKTPAIDNEDEDKVNTKTRKVKRALIVDDEDEEHEIVPAKKPKKELIVNETVKSDKSLDKTKHVKSLAPPGIKKMVIPEKYDFLKNYTAGDKKVHIPAGSFSKFTDFEKQYWEIKKDLMDVILFFKKGKFYEVYENDAILANKLFDWKIAGQSNSNSLINSTANSKGRAGMLMGGVPEMSLDYWINQFVSNGYKVGKVEQLESLLLKNITKANNKKVVQRELECIFTKASMDSIDDSLDNYILALTQTTEGTFSCHMVDLSVNKYFYQEVNDCKDLETFLLRSNPKELILYETEEFDEKIDRILKFYAKQAQWSKMEETSQRDSKTLLLKYLEYLKIEVPQDVNFLQFFTNDKDAHITHMKLESDTLRNLELLKSSIQTKTKGATLFSLINYTQTGMGERLLKKWLLKPLYQPKDIKMRQDSIEFLLDESSNDCLSLIHDCLKKIPDLERLFGRLLVKKNLPFNVFHENVVLKFESIKQLVMLLKASIEDHKGDNLFFQVVNQIDIDELDTVLKEWESQYRYTKVATDNQVFKLELDEGIDEEYDDLNQQVLDLERTLDDLLKEYQTRFSSRKICYKDQGKEILTLECPMEIVKKIPKNWTQTSATKYVKRYYSPELQKLANRMLELKELQKESQKKIIKTLYLKFLKHESLWKSTIDSVSVIDCLYSLSVSSKNLGYPSCKPTIEFSSENFIEFEELRHPYTTATRKSFIPNDISLNINNEKKMTILTGSNSSGKSTVLRMASIAVIMGQLGMYVPCKTAVFTPFSQILTRLGSNDNLLQAKSTYLMEIEDVHELLKNVDKTTFVIIDELGRGGSSKDGFALCEGVIYELLTKSKCLGYLATHYNGLYKSFDLNNTNFKKMDYIIDDNGNMVFLYKCVDGISESSMGLKVAKMCGISAEILQEGEKMAKDLEHTSRLMKIKQYDDNNNDGMISFPGLESDFLYMLDNRDLVTFGRDRGEREELEALTKLLSNIH